MSSPIFNPTQHLHSSSTDSQGIGLNAKPEKESSWIGQELILQGQKHVEEKLLTARTIDTVSNPHKEISGAIVLISNKVNTMIAAVKGLVHSKASMALTSLASELRETIKETRFSSGLMTELARTLPYAVAFVSSAVPFIISISTANPIGALAATIPLLIGLIQASRGALRIAALTFSTLGQCALENGHPKLLRFCAKAIQILDKLPLPLSEEEQYNLGGKVRYIAEFEHIMSSMDAKSQEVLLLGDEKRKPIINELEDDKSTPVESLSRAKTEEEPMQEKDGLKILEKYIERLERAIRDGTEISEEDKKLLERLKGIRRSYT